MPLNDPGWLVLDHIRPFLREKPHGASRSLRHLLWK